MTTENPIETAINYLQECGYSENEAHNLITAVKGKTKEDLTAMLDDWILHAGEHKKYQTCLLDLAAMGIITVTGRDEDGEWLFKLDREMATAAGLTEPPTT